MDRCCLVLYVRLLDLWVWRVVCSAKSGQQVREKFVVNWRRQKVIHFLSVPGYLPSECDDLGFRLSFLSRPSRSIYHLRWIRNIFMIPIHAESQFMRNLFAPYRSRIDTSWMGTNLPFFHMVVIFLEAEWRWYVLIMAFPEVTVQPLNWQQTIYNIHMKQTRAANTVLNKTARASAENPLPPSATRDVSWHGTAVW